MDRRDLQLRLLQDLLAAPGTQDGWHAFLNRLCDGLAGSAASFISHDFGSGEGGISITVRTDPQALATYQQHWHGLDPWAHSPRLKGVPSATVVVGDALIDRSLFNRTEFRNDFGRHYDIVQCIAGMIEVSDHSVSCVSINAADSRPRFGVDDEAFINELMPHLQQAIRIHRRLAVSGITERVTGDVFERLPMGIIVVARDGRPVLVNRAAQRILSRRDGLTLEQHGLCAPTPAVSSTLRALIDQASACSAGDSSSNGGAMTLPRPSNKRDLQVVVSAVPPAHTWDFAVSHAAAVVFVTDPEDAGEADSTVLARLFGLTKREAAVALGLARGERLDEIANDLSITQGTVRWHVKHLLSKTGARTQAQLVQLVLGSPAFLNRPVKNR